MATRVLVNVTKQAFHVYANNGRSFVLNPYTSAQARNAVIAIIQCESQINRRIDEAIRLGHLRVGTMRDLATVKAANVGIIFDGSCKPASSDGPLTSPYCTEAFLRRQFADIADALSCSPAVSAGTEAASEEPPANPLAVAAGTAPAAGTSVRKEFAFRRDLPEDRLGVAHDGRDVTCYVNRSGAFIITPMNKIAAGDLFRISRKDGSFVTHNEKAVFKAVTNAETAADGIITFECIVSATSQPNTESPRAEVVTAPPITPVGAGKGGKSTGTTRSSKLDPVKG